MYLYYRTNELLYQGVCLLLRIGSSPMNATTLAGGGKTPSPWKELAKYGMASLK